MSDNPYSSSSASNARIATGFSPDRLPFVLQTPTAQLPLWIFLSVTFAAISIASLAFAIWTDAHYGSAILTATVFGFGAYVFLTSLFTSLSIDGGGLRIRGLRNAVYEWQDIDSWYKDENGGVLFVRDRKGKKLIIASFAVTPSRTSDVAAAFTHFLGTPSRRQTSTKKDRQRNPEE